MKFSKEFFFCSQKFGGNSGSSNPFTRACLLDTKVKHEVIVLEDGTISLEADPLSHVLMRYKQENKEAVLKINQYGGAGNYLLKEAPKLTAQQKEIADTVHMSLARQDALCYHYVYLDLKSSEINEIIFLSTLIVAIPLSESKYYAYT